jgi:hypothetical protein
MNDSQRGTLWTLAGWLGVAIGTVGFLYTAGIVLFLLGSALDRPPRAAGAPLSTLFPALVLPALTLGPSLLAFCAGLGLVRRRPYGRLCTLAFGALSVVFVALGLCHLWLDLLRHVWQTVHHTELPNGPSLTSRLTQALAEALAYGAYGVGMALLSRSVYSHPRSFEGEGPRIGA